MSKNGSRSECLLERIEIIIIEGVKLSRDVLLDEVY